MKEFCELPPLMPRYIFAGFPGRDCRLYRELRNLRIAGVVAVSVSLRTILQMETRVNRNYIAANCKQFSIRMVNALPKLFKLTYVNKTPRNAKSQVSPSNVIRATLVPIFDKRASLELRGAFRRDDY